MYFVLYFSLCLRRLGEIGVCTLGSYLLDPRSKRLGEWQNSRVHRNTWWCLFGYSGRVLAWPCSTLQPGTCMCIYCHICVHIEVTRLAYLYACLMSRAGNILASGTSTHRPPKYTSSCRMCHIYTVVLLAEYSVQIMGSRRLVSFSPPYIHISFLPSQHTEWVQYG